MYCGINNPKNKNFAFNEKANHSISVILPVLCKHKQGNKIRVNYIKGGVAKQMTAGLKRGLGQKFATPLLGP